MVQDRSFEPSTAIVDGLYCFEYLVDQDAWEEASRQIAWMVSFVLHILQETE
jgi:hypothetical protein